MKAASFRGQRRATRSTRVIRRSFRSCSRSTHHRARRADRGHSSHHRESQLGISVRLLWSGSDPVRKHRLVRSRHPDVQNAPDPRGFPSVRHLWKLLNLQLDPTQCSSDKSPTLPSPKKRSRHAGRVERAQALTGSLASLRRLCYSTREEWHGNERICRSPFVGHWNVPVGTHRRGVRVRPTHWLRRTVRRTVPTTVVGKPLDIEKPPYFRAILVREIISNLMLTQHAPTAPTTPGISSPNSEGRPPNPHFSYPFVTRRCEDLLQRGADRIFRRAVWGHPAQGQFGPERSGSRPQQVAVERV